MKNTKINTVLLTGGTGKIGKKIIEELSKEGYTVFFTSRNKEKITQLENEFSNLGNIKGIEVDLEDSNLTDQLDNFFSEQNNYPNALINNARNIEYLKIEKDNSMLPQNWIGEFKFAVTIPYELTLFLANHPRTTLFSVINVASMYGVVAPNLALYENPHQDSPISYGTCKAAMIHLTKELAVRFADKKIQVNAISYGGVGGRVNESFLKRYENLSPQRKMLQEDELYAPIRFLLSEDATPLTGHNINYDGGWTLW
ncbi:dehydrogenase of unknown specificity, short-chain alcohol dehydrogenase like protein [Bernardetia litoralis DSM 6794]|uniref:Dehydrogenase n=1 Tax=Bernardetia litoralis (strain ATCC 23117 / DSM 6794 / NBRC 15988 / NCIMB 1366 / Fx l1 / Sio-4) TaxID=880071 RepID=I4APH1_BERLS|nr:SDR family NAD(P)-dependent oxidoreductase [Bernardetia litoralis]AFM05856.1 dehydrogenase of unknown specificity, short-chain alcohol dehydrogenase like protein [Bernardetia litoralis DSM 6794]